MAHGKVLSESEEAALFVLEGKVLQVALLWGDRVLELKHFEPGRRVTIGHDPQDAFHVFSPRLGGGFVLGRGGERGWTVRVPSGATAKVHEAGGRPESVLISLGVMQLSVRTVARAPRAKGTLADRDFAFFKMAACCLLFFGAGVLMVHLSPEAPAEVSDEVVQRRYRETITVSRPTPPPPKLSLPAATTERTPSMPNPESTTSSQARPAPGPEGNAPPKKVSAADILGISKNGAMDTVLAPGKLDEAINNALGNIKGSGTAVASADGTGMNGLGKRGTGWGGGGSMKSIGRVGTVNAGPSGDLVALGSKLRSNITSPPPKATRVVGGLDRDVILKVIRSHQSEIRYCYEQELNRNPELAGKVAVSFEIDPTGGVSVAQVAESTLGSDSAEDCIVHRIQNWKFPEPKGGGVVNVNFPWLFRPVGAE